MLPSLRPPAVIVLAFLVLALGMGVFGVCTTHDQPAPYFRGVVTDVRADGRTVDCTDRELKIYRSRDLIGREWIGRAAETGFLDCRFNPAGSWILATRWTGSRFETTARDPHIASVLSPADLWLPRP